MSAMWFLYSLGSKEPINYIKLFSLHSANERQCLFICAQIMQKQYPFDDFNLFLITVIFKLKFPHQGLMKFESKDIPSGIFFPCEKALRLQSSLKKAWDNRGNIMDEHYKIYACAINSWCRRQQNLKTFLSFIYKAHHWQLMPNTCHLYIQFYQNALAHYM